MGVADVYKLTEEEHERIFRQIVRSFLKNKTSTDAPTIVILGGQPGCGKTGLISYYCENLFSDGNVCHINGDELRRFHPKSDEIFLLYEKQYTDITDSDVRVWTKELFDLAIEQSVNITFEGTMRTPEICETIKRLSAAGYHIIVSPMAVPFIISAYSICNRYLIAKKETGKARFVSFSSHSEAYTAMISTLVKIISDKFYNDMAAYGRILNGLEAITAEKDEEIPEEIKRYRLKKLSLTQKRRLNLLTRSLVLDLNQINENEISVEFEKIYQDWQSVS